MPGDSSISTLQATALGKILLMPLLLVPVSVALTARAANHAIDEMKKGNL